MMKMIYKSFGRVYLFWTIFVLVVVPIINLRYMILFESVDACYELVCQILKIFLPVLSVWWAYFSMKESVEGDGKEVLWVYMAGNKGILKDVLIGWVWYVLHIVAVLLFHAIWFPSMQIVFLEILAQSLFFTGFFVLLTNVFKNAGMAFLVVFSYCFAMIHFTDNTIFYSKRIVLGRTL
jgi:hypothetical protein